MKHETSFTSDSVILLTSKPAHWAIIRFPT